MPRKLQIVQVGALLALLVALAASPAALAQPRISAGEALTRVAHTATTSPLIAPAETCPGQTSLAATQRAQAEAMLCMTNFARAGAGLPPLSESTQLEISAQGKSGDVLRCGEFSHFACDRDFTYWMQQSGYIGESCWHAGENLAWGAGEYGSVRSIFRAWMASTTHRQNILGDYREVGINVSQGAFESHRRASVWTSHFGSHCES
jgi:uncharacterized protein YkwD